jgi:hypothetical protein
VKKIKKLILLILTIGSMGTGLAVDENLELAMSEVNKSEEQSRFARAKKFVQKAWNKAKEHKGKIIAGVACVAAVGLAYYYRRPKTIMLNTFYGFCKVYQSTDDVHKAFVVNEYEKIFLESVDLKNKARLVYEKKENVKQNGLTTQKEIDEYSKLDNEFQRLLNEADNLSGQNQSNLKNGKLRFKSVVNKDDHSWLKQFYIAVPGQNNQNK